MSNAPTGRSPFPGRNRRRLSAETTGDHHDPSSFTSPLMMGSLLSQSRVSPAAAWSPVSAAQSTSTRRSRRFFESSDRKQEAPTKATTNEDVVDGMNLSQIRSLARTAVQSPTVTALPSTAGFYASILYSKTNAPEDAYLYAQALVANGEASRAVKLLERSGLLVPDHPEAILLAAQSMASQGEWTEALALVETACVSPSTGALLEDEDDAGWTALVQSTPAQPDSIHAVARLCLLRGKAYDETSNPNRAALYWKRALRMDPTCVEALDCLLKRNMLQPQEAYDLIYSLNIEKMEWLRNLYMARVHVPANNNNDQDPPMTGVDASSIQMATPSSLWDENNQKMPARASVQRDVATAFDKLTNVYKLSCPETLELAAHRAYRQYDFTAALEYCEKLTEMDPLYPTISFVYVATLVSLGHKRLLFQLAHEWVDATPRSAHAWFAVGCYYYACNRFHVAQRHFCRATRLDPQCTEAWIAFGCSFSQCDESDQALASFRAAQRLAPAHFCPLLYMGMEYLRTNHLVLARHFLMAAHKASGGDALALHELGVADYQRGEYATATVWFTRALKASSKSEGDDVVDLCDDEFWEPSLFNLGQCFRKTKQLDQAERCFSKCLALCPGSAPCLSTLAFTKHLKGDIDGAIELYHQALGQKPDDALCSEMLNKALKEALSIPTDEPSSEPSAMFSPSFRSPRTSLRRSMETDDGHDLSLDSSDDDVSMG